jgi:hypothetical protein
MKIIVIILYMNGKSVKIFIKKFIRYRKNFCADKKLYHFIR